MKSYHVTVEVVMEQMVLIQAEDEEDARARVMQGEGEIEDQMESRREVISSEAVSE
jgi:hypothetical protein